MLCETEENDARTGANVARIPDKFRVKHESLGDDLYFATCGPYVKIGRAKDVLARMRSMQSGNPDQLDIICRLPGRGYEEKVWHAAFFEDRGRGEWFARTEGLDIAIMLARNDYEWWHHLNPPFDFLCENCEDIEDEDEISEAVVDWHIGLFLFRWECWNRDAPSQETNNG